MVMLVDLRCRRDYFVSLMLILERDRERGGRGKRERERERMRWWPDGRVFGQLGLVWFECSFGVA